MACPPTLDTVSTIILLSSVPHSSFIYCSIRIVISTMSKKSSSFIDESTECAICLNALDSEETITLACGHRWHLECLREQIERAKPSHSTRLVFAGCRCAKCFDICDHPALDSLTKRKTDELRERVDALILEQLRADLPEKLANSIPSSSSMARLLDEGRRTYAFYLCGSCDEPYFGGTIECADDHGGAGELNTSEERLCQSCSPKAQVVCRQNNNIAHRPFLIWKCRYCCNPSTFLCYGGIHLCGGCHDRNSQRVLRDLGPRTMDGIPCRGEGCTFPKPVGCERHSNGPSLDCEQVYKCIACETSASSSSARTTFQEIPGSRNFIINPSGEEGARGWQNVSGHEPWVVERMEIPVDETTRCNFVSSFRWAGMGQIIPLHQVLRNPSRCRLEVSAKFMGRSDCPSSFHLKAIVLDSHRRAIYETSLSPVIAPADFWEKMSVVIENVQGAHEMVMIVRGKDNQFWRGNFGSKVCHCSVRVLGSQEELDDNLLISG